MRGSIIHWHYITYLTNEKRYGRHEGRKAGRWKASKQEGSKEPNRQEERKGRETRYEMGNGQYCTRLIKLSGAPAVFLLWWSSLRSAIDQIDICD